MFNDYKPKNPDLPNTDPQPWYDRSTDAEKKVVCNELLDMV